MFKRYFILLISSVSISLNALTIEELADRFNKSGDDTGTFIQMKTLSDIGVTLTSTGTYEFKKNKYVKWTTLKPLQSDFIATQKDYTSVVNGKSVKRKLADLKMSKSMKSLVEGDISSLKDTFSLKIKKNSIIAHPKQRELKEFIDNFVLEFNDAYQPTRFIMTFSNSDVLDIVLKRSSK